MARKKVLVWLIAAGIAGAILPLMELGRVAHFWPSVDLHLSIPLALAGLPLLLFSLIALSHQFIASHLTSQDREVVDLEVALEKQLRRYKSLLEGAGNAIFVFNAESGAMEEVNRLGTELLGYSQEELTARRGSDLVAEEDLGDFMALVMRVKRRGRGRSSGVTFCHKDSSRRVCEIDARLIDLGDERLVHVTVRDVTLRHQAKREIRQRNHELTILNAILTHANDSLRLRNVLEVSLAETMALFDSEAGTVHLLAGDRRTLVLAGSKAMPPSLEEELHSMSLARDACCRMVTHLSCHSVATADLDGCFLSGRLREAGWGSVVAVPLIAHNVLIGVMHLMNCSERLCRDDELRFLTTLGKQVGIVIEHARVFGQLREKNDELERSHTMLERSSRELALSQKRLRKNLELVEEANRELERLDRMKNHFLGMVSHEFKTPLTSIIGSSELLLAAHCLEAPEDLRRLLEIILQGGIRLNDIVNDLLKVARLEAKSLLPNRNIVHLEEVLNTIHERFSPILVERCQTLLIDKGMDHPPFNADRGFIEDVFGELLENAVKFTPDGGVITIVTRCSCRDDLYDRKAAMHRFNQPFWEQMDDRPFLMVEVRDSGIGISSEEHLRIFDTFYEVGEINHHSSGKHKFQGKGTGLGLAIVKGMVEAHGGMVWVESSVDEGETGSVFCFLIPMGEPTLQPELPLFQDGN